MKPKVRHRTARCNQVLCVLVNRLETVDLLREVVCPQTGGDYEVGPLEVAVVRYRGLEVHLPLDTVVFLRNGPPRPHPVLSERRRRTLNKVAARVKERTGKALAEPAEPTSREEFESKMKEPVQTTHKQRSKKEALETLTGTGLYTRTQQTGG